MSYGAATIVTAALKVISANDRRLSHIITNQGPSTVFLGPDSSLTTNTGIALSSGSNLTEDSGGDKLYQGDIYAISESSSNLRYWERTRG